jgi:hypothetical protein
MKPRRGSWSEHVQGLTDSPQIVVQIRGSEFAVRVLNDAVASENGRNSQLRVQQTCTHSPSHVVGAANGNQQVSE